MQRRQILDDLNALPTEQLNVPAAVDGRCVEQMENVTLFFQLGG